MPSLSDTILRLARIYSDAMFGLAEARGEADTMAAELRELAAAMERDPAFHGYFSSPLVDPEARRETLEKLVRGRSSDLLVDSLQVLNRKRRLSLIPAIAQAYEHTLNERRGRIEVHVTSAIPLSDAQRQSIRAAVQKRLRRDAILEETVDPSLIGGAVFRIGDEKTDDSVATHLDSLGKALLARASREIQAGSHAEP